jgi:Predicted AAA-ATPase
MKKKFNITGLCFPQKHYMADVSKKMAQTFAMVEEGDYFIINRPRQYGKTTTLYTLADMLRKTGDYVVLNSSFEGIGDVIFDSEENFSQGFVEILAKYASIYMPDAKVWLEETAPQIRTLKQLTNMITTFVNKSDKKVVLMIDEVDKSSNNQLFISFLAMLRNKYLERDSFKTFHSVVLAGLHDVKSLKLKLRPDEEAKLNSPWNIAAEYKVDMNLQPSEIKPMLDEYAADKSVKMNTQQVAEQLFYYTSGYPFLVSKLCKMFDEDYLPLKNDKEWTIPICTILFTKLRLTMNLFLSISIIQRQILAFCMVFLRKKAVLPFTIEYIARFYWIICRSKFCKPVCQNLTLVVVIKMTTIV